MTAARVQYVNAPDGVAHTADTVARMATLAREGSHTYAIRSLATRITHHVPGKDTRGELAAIYQWVRDTIRYRYDPRGLEWIQAPDRTVQEKAGDCDDMAILIAALAQSIGHRTRFRTVGKTDKRQSHVHAQAFDGQQWIALDPVLEPRQSSTAPRPELGAFGFQAPGAERLYNERGQPMHGIPSKRAIQLWQPTNFEVSPQGRPVIATQYRSRGSAGRPTPIRLSLWKNAYDPHDLSGQLNGLGFNFLKAIGSVAKVAGAVGVPGASALSMGIDVGGSLLAKKKAAAQTVPRVAVVPPGAVAVAGPGAQAPAGYAPQGSTQAPINVAPIVAAGLQASREAQQLLASQSRYAIEAIAHGQQTAAPAPRRRQKWDPVTRRWTVYQESGLGAFKPSITFAMGAAAAMESSPASDLAARLVQSIRSKGRAYDRQLASDFQRAAGIGVDGKYGGGTAGAVKYFTGATPPRPMFAPFQVRPYTPINRDTGPGTVITAPANDPRPRLTGGSGLTAATWREAPATATEARLLREWEARQARRAATPAPVAVPVSSPINYSPASLTRRQMAAALINTVQKITQQTGRPPVGVVPGAINYQIAAGIGSDGKYGPVTRAAAAADLGVAASTLPATAYDGRAYPRTPRTRRAAAPAVFEPTHTTPNDPGLPTFPGGGRPAEAPAVASSDDNTKWWILAGAYYLSKKQRQTNGRRRPR